MATTKLWKNLPSFCFIAMKCQWVAVDLAKWTNKQKKKYHMKSHLSVHICRPPSSMVYIWSGEMRRHAGSLDKSNAVKVACNVLLESTWASLAIYKLVPMCMCFACSSAPDDSPKGPFLRQKCVLINVADRQATLGVLIKLWYNSEWSRADE